MSLYAWAHDHPRSLLLLATAGSTIGLVQIIKAVIDVCPW